LVDVMEQSRRIVPEPPDGLFDSPGHRPGETSLQVFREMPVLEPPANPVLIPKLAGKLSLHGCNGLRRAGKALVDLDGPGTELVKPPGGSSEASFAVLCEGEVGEVGIFQKMDWTELAASRIFRLAS